VFGLQNWQSMRTASELNKVITGLQEKIEWLSMRVQACEQHIESLLKVPSPPQEKH
jgi:hypothetical protein